MRRPLGSCLPAAVLVATLGALAACSGDDSGGVARDPAPTSASTPTTSTTTPTPDPEGIGTAAYTVVDIVTVTAAGGTVDPQAVPMGDDAARQAFLAQFKAEAMATQVQDVVDTTDVPDGQQLYAAVVALGCDAPTDVYVIQSAGGVTITAAPVASPKPECLAPMTSVALALAPTNGLVG